MKAYCLLLDKTPNPWYSFYSKEALGVKSWDMYKYVMSAETGKMAALGCRW